MKGLLALCLAAIAHAQLQGVVDIHCHQDPDSVPRSIDAIDLARLPRQAAMRGLVLKNHYESTASLAYHVHNPDVGASQHVGGFAPRSAFRPARVAD
jgi:hypothetical protein